MRLSEQLKDYIHAAFTGLYVHTLEPDEAEREIVDMARERKWRLAIWDVAQGLRVPGSNADVGAGDPIAAIKALPGFADPEGKGTSILVLHNFHRFLNSPEVVQTTFAQLVAGKAQRTFLVVVASVVQVPVELEKLFVVIEHALPDREQLRGICQEIHDGAGVLSSVTSNWNPILDAAAGLTRYEAEGAFALSIARHNAIRPDAIWELKAQTLKKSNLLTLHRGGERFSSLGGLSNMKDFCRRALQGVRSVKPRGVLLLGVPGSGKSAFARALGSPLTRRRGADDPDFWKDADRAGGEAAAARPGAELLDRLAGGDGDRDDLLGGLVQRQVEQRRQPTTRLDLRAGPVVVGGLLLVGRDVEFPTVHLPDCCPFVAAGEIQEEDRIEAFSAGELGRQLRDVVRRADEEDVGFVVGEPSEHSAEEPRRLFLQLELRDRTGSISARMWNATEHLFKSFETGDFLKVKGKVQLFQGSLQVSCPGDSPEAACRPLKWTPFFGQG